MINMFVSNEKILELQKYICYNFSNSQYLAVSGKHDFDDVRGTKLWKLWYSNEHLSIATLSTEHGRYLAGKYSASQYYKCLKCLKRCFKYEFFKIRIKKLFGGI